jgi:nitrogen fixation protein FixH
MSTVRAGIVRVGPDGGVRRAVPTGRGWVVMVLVMLAAHAGIVAYTIRAAHSDQGFAVEPGYYQRALEWDRAKADQAKAEAAGWSGRAWLEGGGAGGVPRLTARLTEGVDGARGLEGCEVTAEVFAQARPGARVTVKLVPEGDGRYSAGLPVNRAGLWEVRLTARKGGITYARTETLLVGG